MPRCARLLFLALLISTCGSQLLPAQESCVTDKANPCNGISVGKPKVFDNRTLTLMIDNLSATLQGMQTGFIDQKSVAAALANIQGFQSHDVTSNFQVNTLPLPGITQQVTKNTGIVDANGNPLPDTTQTQTTTTQNSFTPTPPTLNSVPTFSGFNPNYGENAADLFTDQVNLTYQIFNLRMILDRALSDRLLAPAALGQNATRLQAVLGFNVTIDPPRTANDAVAVVEITLNDAADPGDLSLVALMPQEKTYNAASLSTKSHTYGGTAVVKTIQVGYSQRRSGQTFYLYRDNDTISYERMDPVTNQLIFGWMFRPVLGRRSVSPGLRQLFAVVSLPHHDCTRGELSQKAIEDVKALGACQATLSAKVRTYWKKYDAGTLTSFSPLDENRATTLKYIATLGLTRPQLFEGRYENSSSYPDILVNSSSIYETQLGPVIDRVSWVPVGSKNALVSVIGNNFFSGTQVSIGDKTYIDGGGALILKSNQAFDLTVPLEALASGTSSVIGRYGPAEPLIPRNPNPVPKGSMRIGQVTVGPASSGVRSLSVVVEFGKPNQVVTKSQSGELFAQLPKLRDVPKALAKTSVDLIAPPVMTVNGSVVPMPYKLSVTQPECDPQTDNCYGGTLTIESYVPESSLSCNGLLKLTYPFLGDPWTAYYAFYTGPSCRYPLTRLSDNRLLVESRGEPGFTAFDPTTLKPSKTPWTLITDSDRIPFSEDRCKPNNASAKCTRLSDYGYIFDVVKVADTATAEKPTAEKKPQEKGKTVSSEKDTKTTTSAPGKLPDKIVLVSPIGAASTLDVPKATADASKDAPIMLHQYDSVWKPITGDDLTSVDSVQVNQKKLNFRKPDLTKLKPGEKVTSVMVEISRDITAKPGNVDVAVLDKNGKALTTAHLQIVCTDCKNSDGGK